MKKDNRKLESLLRSVKASSILLAIIYSGGWAKITDISGLLKRHVLDSTIRKMEKTGLVESKKSVFSVDWTVLMPALLNLQKERIWVFEKPTYELLPEHAIITPSKLDELVRKMQDNPYLRDLYDRFLSMYFEYTYDIGVKKSIYELLVEDFFDHLLPRYYNDIKSSISPVLTSKVSEVADFKKFLELTYEVATSTHTLEGAALRDAIDFSSPIFLVNLVASELEKQGFKSTREYSVGDSRLDFLVEINGKKIGIEVKAYKNSVIPAQVIESLGKSRADLDELILISSANFSSSAIEAAKRSKIRILTVDKIDQIGRLLKTSKPILHLVPHSPEKRTRQFNDLFKEIRERTKTATTNDEKKKSLEDLAEAIVKQIDGLEVLSRNLRSSAEEIDLLIGNESKEVFWSRLSSPFLLECKNWAVPVGSKEIRDFAGKLESAGITTGLLITLNGITGNEYKDARLLIREYRQKGIRIVVVENDDLLEIANGIHPSDKIREKFYEIFKI